ncbi:MAG: hypothetical protein A3F68_08675 [Acidobacteria bacterium RIFCSPLOWO2_12_FULL_54_10]|nr:MAG: hypothetical protein A3F68_08675 [Acidobacteria bacterium RIFCSPLOWO2_12_FULL_54_10]
MQTFFQAIQPPSSATWINARAGPEGTEIQLEQLSEATEQVSARVGGWESKIQHNGKVVLERLFSGMQLLFGSANKFFFQKQPD